MHVKLTQLFTVLKIWWKGWRSVADDPPPEDVEIMGLCDYTGVRSVTEMRNDIALRRWKDWYMNQPTHWQHLPDALPIAQEPPASEPLAIFKSRRRQGEDVIITKEP